MEALTRQQAAVVADRNADILVSAGAGSGKTRVLVERYVALLAECRIPQIAAVTFTDAAATEMRERVRREVRGRAELACHLRDIDQAVIGTIHSLCLQMLREHPVAAGGVAAARILPDDEAEYERIGGRPRRPGGRGAVGRRPRTGDTRTRRLLAERTAPADDRAQGRGTGGLRPARRRDHR